MYWEQEIETMNREALSKLQGTRLAETLERAKKSVHYGKLFTEMGLNAGDIRSVGDPLVVFNQRDQGDFFHEPGLHILVHL